MCTASIDLPTVCLVAMVTVCKHVLKTIVYTVISISLLTQLFVVNSQAVSHDSYTQHQECIKKLREGEEHVTLHSHCGNSRVSRVYYK